MHQFLINDIKKALAIALDTDQTHAGKAGGTVAFWAEAPSGAVVCVTDGDGGDPFSEWGGNVEASSFAVGLYGSVDQYMDGEMYDSLHIVDADESLTALMAKVKELTAPAGR